VTGLLLALVGAYWVTLLVKKQDKKTGAAGRLRAG